MSSDIFLDINHRSVFFTLESPFALLFLHKPHSLSLSIASVMPRHATPRLQALHLLLVHEEAVELVDLGVVLGDAALDDVLYGNEADLLAVLVLALADEKVANVSLDHLLHAEINRVVQGD